MKAEFIQRYNGPIGTPNLVKIETTYGFTAYSYGTKTINEEEFITIHKKIKNSDLYSVSKKVVVYNEKGEKISDVCFSKNITQKSLKATIQVDKNILLYNQIQQLIGLLYIKGKHAINYTHICFGKKESEYIDIQPSKNDPLIPLRDKTLKPYLDVINGFKTLSSLTTPNNEPSPVL